MADLTSTMRASRMYNNARSIASGKVDLEVSWGTVGGILLLGFFYMVTASIGINIFSKCESMKGKAIQENLNKYLAATLTSHSQFPSPSSSPNLLRTKLVSSPSYIPSWVSLDPQWLSTGLSSVRMPRRLRRVIPPSVSSYIFAPSSPLSTSLNPRLWLSPVVSPPGLEV